MMNHPVPLATVRILFFLWSGFLCHSSWGVDVHPRHCGGGVRHVHLAVGPDPATSMIVSFASIPSRFTPVPVGGVRVGRSSSHLEYVFREDRRESPRHYNLTVPRRKWGNDGAEHYWSPYYHHVVLRELQPDTTYYYQPLVQPTWETFEEAAQQWHAAGHWSKEQASQALVQEQQSRARNHGGGRRRRLTPEPYDGSSKECPPMDKVRSFRTAPAPHAEPHALFAILGDLGQFPHSEQTMARVLESRNDVDALVLAGDIAYTGTDHRRWDTFFDFWDDYAVVERIPMQIVPGNHDIDKGEISNQIFLAYQNRFRMPEVQPAQLRNFDGPDGRLNMDKPPYPLPYDFGNAYYSWKYAGVHFFMLSAYSSMKKGSLQRRWFNKELQAVDRKETPWVFVVIHTPIYNTFGLHQNDPQMQAAKEHLEPLFVQYHVNIVFSGHIHAYQRTHAVALDKLDASGPVHITVGAGGRKCEAPFLNAEPEEWVAVRDATKFGYGTIQIHNATTAEWNWIHTGENEDRDYNQLWHSEEQLPPGPTSDRVFIQNQYPRRRR